MGEDIMPRIGLNLESVEKEIHYNSRTIYITAKEFEKLINSKEDGIIAVELNDIFIKEFLPKKYNINLFLDMKYFIFNMQFGMEQSGSFENKLNGEDVYIVVPTYKEIEDNTINEVLTIKEASEMWSKDVSTLRRVIHSSKFREGIDYRKSGNTWLITKKSMIRVYGRLVNNIEGCVVMLRDLIKKENIRYEIYVNSEKSDRFHTDNINFFASNDVNYFEEIGIDFEKVLDLDCGSFGYEVMNREAYENTVLANSSEGITDEEFPVLVISIDEEAIEELTN